jgi:hypothetical protein
MFCVVGIPHSPGVCSSAAVPRVVHASSPLGEVTPDYWRKDDVTAEGLETGH